MNKFSYTLYFINMFIHNFDSFLFSIQYKFVADVPKSGESSTVYTDFAKIGPHYHDFF